MDPHKFNRSSAKRILAQAAMNGVPIINPQADQPLQIRIGHKAVTPAGPMVVVSLSFKTDSIILPLAQAEEFVRGCIKALGACTAEAAGEQTCPKCKRKYKEHEASIGPGGDVTPICPEPEEDAASK